MREQSVFEKNTDGIPCLYQMYADKQGSIVCTQCVFPSKRQHVKKKGLFKECILFFTLYIFL